MSTTLTQHDIEQIKKTLEEELKRFSEYQLLPKLKKIIEEIVHDEGKTLKEDSAYIKERFLHKDEATAAMREIKELLPKKETPEAWSGMNN